MSDEVETVGQKSSNPFTQHEESGQRTREFRAQLVENARRELEEERLEPERRCSNCGAKLTVQVLPHGGYEAHCTPCERRARSASAGTDI